MGFGSALGSIATLGGIAGGIFAGNEAASAQRGAASSAAKVLRGAKGEAVGELRPYADYGQQALMPLSALIYGQEFNPETGDFTPIDQAERFKYFQESPGYQFQLEEGLKAIERRNADTGTLMSGNTLKELQTFGSNLANQEYGSYLDTLMNQAGLGSTASTNIANITSGVGGQLANYSYQGGMANANKYANLSNALFGLGGMGAANAFGGGGSPYNPTYFGGR